LLSRVYFLMVKEENHCFEYSELFCKSQIFFI